MKYILLIFLIVNLNAFIVTVGGFSACKSKMGSSSPKNCSYSKQKPLYYFLRKEAPNVNSITMWITRDWKDYWYSVEEVNNFIKRGYIPVYIFYFFADDISPIYVIEKEKEYFKLLREFIRYLNQIKGEKIVILNPEYNENGMSDSVYFDKLQSKSIIYLKQRVKNIKVGVCLGDFGNYSLIWDKYAWDLSKPSLKSSAFLSDFIAFQEMRALTRNSKEDILNTPLRALGFASYLHKTYNKPTFLAYLAVSSYKDEHLQAEVFKKFAKLMPLFKNIANLEGIGVFHYIDVPTHKGYFNEAEKYFGVKKYTGEKKESFKYFLNFK